jgi:hypothetical protein
MEEAKTKYSGSQLWGARENYVNFMKAENNALVRSFESTRGRGLAGFITQMSLGYDGAPWEVEKTQRAPQFVEITMSFSPIHDLPLGLDYRGRLIAPSHPVGLAHTNPWDSITTRAPPDESDSPTDSEALMKDRANAEAARLADAEDPAGGDGVPTGPEAPSSPMSLGGFDISKLASMAGSLGKLKDLI